MSDAAEHITQKYLRRWPKSKKARSWAGRMVYIETDNGVWRHGGKGYTWAGTPEAGIWSFEDAQREVSHYGPEKRAAFIWADSVKPRADLPPTPSAALAEPQVRAIVEAAKEWADARRQHVQFDGKDLTGFQAMFDNLANAEGKLFAATAALNVGKGE